MQEIGGYEIIEKIGAGGMATVYRGVQVSLNRPVAVKVLSRQLSGDREMLDRFNRESVIIAQLAHPNIVHVIDRGVTPTGMPYFVMEYLEGSDLTEIIRDGEADLNRKLDLMIQVCKALSYAHKNGVIHRDIKPANVRIDADGNARVLDFGIAQFYDDERHADHTQAGTVMGTFAYMSPEQQGSTDRVTAASDLYSAGAVMYELCTGVKPVGRFRRPREIDPEIPEPLETVILRCLEPDPAKRFASADEVKDHLLKLLQGAHLQNTQKEPHDTGEGNPGDKFALLDVIKENRFGAVYLYEGKVDHKFIVIKRRPSTNAGYTEAKLLTTLKHRSIANILGASKNDQTFIVVMEYVSGGSLKDRLNLPIPWGEVLRIGRQIAEGFSFAHRNRIIHGNLRPSNVLFTESGQVKLTDFGLDEHYEDVAGMENWYSVPGEPRSPSSDVFAAGVLFCQMLCASLPTWDGENLVLHGYLKLIPEPFQEMLVRMCVRQRGVRYTSFEQIVAAIDGLLAADVESIGRLESAGAPEAATVFESSQETGESRDARPKKSPSPGNGLPFRRLGLELALLGTLATVVFYLNYTGDLEPYGQALFGGWEKITAYFATVLGN